MPAAPPIDAVYTWVDGARPDYVELLRRHAAAPRDLNPERFRDPFECLRHSLRSLERHAPWIRRVYLFTCRPHVPGWIRRDHPRLRLVHHDEVVAEPDVLPTFNSNVIELFLHRLPGISEQFLYFNDDYFLGAPLTPEHFHAPDGRIRVCGTWLGEHFRSRIVERHVLSFGLLEHAPIFVVRDVWERMQEVAVSKLAELRRHRFRQPDDVRTERLYRWYALTHARDQFVAEPFWRYLRYARFLKLKDRPARLARQLARLRTAPPIHFCLNDDLGPQPSPAATQVVKEFLAGAFPAPSSFEQTPAQPILPNAASATEDGNIGSR